jgi:DNA-binding HxlR family transcriptional regulator
MASVATGSDAGGVPPGRTYGDACAAARALDVVGERWALLIVRELLFGPKRFTDLQAGMPAARPSVLSQRLRELAGAEVIRRRNLGPPTRVWVYELTEWGRDLEPILTHLGRWGRRLPLPHPDADLGPDALMLALKSHFDAGKAGDLDATYLIALGDDHFAVRVGAGRLEISRSEPHDPVLAVHTDAAAWRAVVLEGRKPGRFAKEGRFVLVGDAGALPRLLNALS